ncbi:hypothetical protein NDI85_21030 [Halomicroarcula sp. S1AR25-4]|uniref:hypothetical protein n=1 Tax=Haloarcula sp. S1AR25-4 TaxID=2950538 RepID=UPI002875E660|nr:hypothetical protein [Halomicroarcula sp. S1AR25-4]MDS0280271.1 hypothetical protein [Halomicroarcula sp. S1AR25-4]
MEFLDDEGLLTEAQDLLEAHTDLSTLSSSTDAAIITDRYQGGNTKLVTHRVRADLKERFKKFADKHDAASYGRLLAAALDTYVDGGAARRLLNDVERLVGTATTTGSTDGSVENVASTSADPGSTDESVENTLSTETKSATTSGSRPDPMVVADAADEICDGDGPGDLRMFPEAALESAIASAAGSDDEETYDRYRDPVLEQLNAGEHPHTDGMYITEWAREEETLWADLDKAERLILLRRWAVREAIDNGERQSGFTYTDVIELFEKWAKAGPSHQYAYDLMEAAADEPGFEYGKHSVGTQSPKLLLRVDVSKVDQSILDWIDEETGLDRDKIGVVADVTSYSAGSSPQQEGAADD